MSQTRPDSTVRRQRGRSKDLSAPQLRAVRKEILLLRADVERAELRQATADLRRSVSNFSWLKLLVPGFGSKQRGGKGFNASLSELVAQHPLVSSIASMVLAKPLRGALKHGVKPALKWGGLGLALWEAYRIWRHIKQDRPDRSETDGNDEDAVSSS
ncbi:DUF3318 domain-containing protein [Trinickia terrae]|uniref:DUF3318 domain-containing protein n=1 Tax=Trinickia terrae TaxID=2571161 RepID=A0A4U1IC88_9BURK|nr:DUF3318 domain-containing protein [Trinickia terrae]TKC91127.1 DUF3318 domain-containing protein [Trinickia terrae]